MIVRDHRNSHVKLQNLKGSHGIPGILSVAESLLNGPAKREAEGSNGAADQRHLDSVFVRIFKSHEIQETCLPSPRASSHSSARGGRELELS
jgi:hypothetical protein